MRKHDGKKEKEKAILEIKKVELLLIDLFVGVFEQPFW
jgi:hypothetical protein